MVLLDQARWHTAKALKRPDNITLLHLPRVSPELNPVENIWQLLRGNRLPFQLYRDRKAIIQSCCNAWNWLVDQPSQIASTGHRQWAKVNA